MGMAFEDVAARERIIVALDCGPAEALDIAERLAGHARWVKVGMTLYYAVGPSIVRSMHKLGYKVFVDLKLHDIPHQVRGAAQSLGQAGADLITVHASGGEAMMAAALAGARKGASLAGAQPPLVCAITVLTSMDALQLAACGVSDSPMGQVTRLASLAQRSGLDGIVCSPQEAAAMRSLLGPSAAIVTPGVRPAGSAVGDQSRIATPAEALAAGASHLVIGRPITCEPDVVAAFEGIAASLA